MSDEIWCPYVAENIPEVLLQGDLIRFGVPPDYSYGVVVTADCDLDKRKHSRMVTLVPLLPVSEIICRCLAYDLFEYHRDKLAIYCRGTLKIEDEIDSDLFTSIVRVRLKDESLDPDVVFVARVLAHDPVDLTIDSIKRCLELIGISWKKAVDRFKNQLKDRGDLLVLTVPESAEGSPQVAWLRALWQEQVSGIALRTSDSTNAKGVRMAQLGSPYRYRLTQMLAQVFSDIGLPDISHATLQADLTKL